MAGIEAKRDRELLAIFRGNHGRVRNGTGVERCALSQRQKSQLATCSIPYQAAQAKRQLHCHLPQQ